MPITIAGSGTITGISAGGLPDASVNTEDLNAGTASSGQKLVASGASGAMTWGSSIVSGTAQNSTSGTSIDFTGIPSWVKRVTVMFNGVSTNGSSGVLIRIGTSAGVQTTGYVVVGTNAGQSQATSGTATDGLYLDYGSPTSASVRYGIATLALLDSSAGLWVFSATIGHQIGASNYLMAGGGNKTLSGTLDRVRITTVNGTDTFDAGSINIMWE